MQQIELRWRNPRKTGEPRAMTNGSVLLLVALLGSLALAACAAKPNPDQPVSSDDTIQGQGAAGTGTEIIGVVSDENGTPLAEAGVAVTKGTSPVPEMLVLTDQDGKYAWGVPAGTYTLTVHKDGYEDLSKEVQVKQGEQAKLDFQLKKLP